MQDYLATAISTVVKVNQSGCRRVRQCN